MILRLMLVGLATSMGLELPSGRDLSCWAESGRAWADARLSDLAGPVVECGPDLAVAACSEGPGEPDGPTAEAEGFRATADPAFEVAVERIVDEFAADLVATRARELESGPVVAMVDGPMLVGLPEGEELSGPRDPADGVASESETAGESAEVDDPDSRSSRLSSALQMTREAVRAWADVMAECPADADADAAR